MEKIGLLEKEVVGLKKTVSELQVASIDIERMFDLREFCRKIEDTILRSAIGAKQYSSLGQLLDFASNPSSKHHTVATAVLKSAASRYSWIDDLESYHSIFKDSKGDNFSHDGRPKDRKSCLNKIITSVKAEDATLCPTKDEFATWLQANMP